MNPDVNPDVLDGPGALRTSPYAEEKDERLAMEKLGMEGQIKEEEESGSSLSELSDVESPAASKKVFLAKQTRRIKEKAGTAKSVKAEDTSTKPVDKESIKEPQFLDPEAEGEEEANEEEIQAALSRPPPVHSDYLPLPWKGRLGYVSLYLASWILPALTSTRPACVLTSASQILPYSAQELVVLRQSLRTAIR